MTSIVEYMKSSTIIGKNQLAQKSTLYHFSSFKVHYCGHTSMQVAGSTCAAAAAATTPPQWCSRGKKSHHFSSFKVRYCGHTSMQVAGSTCTAATTPPPLQNAAGFSGSAVGGKNRVKFKIQLMMLKVILGVWMAFRIIPIVCSFGKKCRLSSSPPRLLLCLRRYMAKSPIESTSIVH